ncbi:MAG: cobalamin biosynthesis protein CbiM [Thermodesulfobacterium geofontis]|uniref:Cobalamin biosynthesis protein CbiM n=1 Tax=Thermodesulfobacterium geofontis TaxID=1295609 RepID=A0A2N7Q6W7_9BACT|nr:MAG: cobalamin biosynthesis protein CbiM [Thermodesulfobacterium geofontis]
MHISEGVLSPPVLLAGGILSFIGLVFGLKNLKTEKIPEIAVLSSTFFVASLIHIPIGPTSAHLVLNGIIGLLLGWSAFPAIFLGLLLQALLFQFGGFTTLGVNTFAMAFPPVVLGYIFKKFLHKNKYFLTFSVSFLTGFLSIIFSAILIGTALYFTEKSFLPVIIALLSAHFPIAIIEGFITGFVVAYLLKVKPEVVI